MDPLKNRDHNANLVFADFASRGTIPEGIVSSKPVSLSGASIAMEFPGFDHAALWTRPRAPFLCLEAWTGMSDPEGFAGDLFEKPGMRILQPGASARHEARYVVRAR